MIHELKPKHFSLVRPLYEELTYNLVIESVIAGNTHGRVWVDHPTQPTAALLWNWMDALLLAGDPQSLGFNRALKHLVRQDLLPDARDRHLPSFSCHYTEAWKPQLASVLAELVTTSVRRRYYTLEGLRIDWRSRIDPELVMRPIDEALLSDESLENGGSVLGWILSFWPSVEAFVSRGIGYCLLADETIASWCLSVFVCDRRYELGLETAPPFRRRNYASLTAAACVEHCLDGGLEPLWHCGENNPASSAVAEKVGFRKALDYEVRQIKIQPA